MSHDPTNATLIFREDLTDTLSIVRVQPDSGVAPDFVPGQFVRLGLPRPQPPGHTGRVRYTRRAYSIGSSPLVREYLEFFVVRIDEGELTPKLWEIHPGDRVWMDPVAKGEFRIDLAPRGKDLVMVATGTGIAPFISMLRTYRHEGYWRHFILVHGSRARTTRCTTSRWSRASRKKAAGRACAAACRRCSIRRRSTASRACR